MSLEIIVDREACIGAQNCVFEAPEVFGIDDEGLAVVLEGAQPVAEDVLRAAASCPTEAIHVRQVGPTSG